MSKGNWEKLVRAFCWIILVGLSQRVLAQSAGPLPDAPNIQRAIAAQPRSRAMRGYADPAEVTFLGTPKRIVLDEGRIITSPARLKASDAGWLLPLAATTGVLIGTDAHTMTLEHINANDQQRASRLTDGTLGLLGALPAGMLLWNTRNYAPLARETGVLTGESLADAMILDEAGRAIFRRSRPTLTGGRGDFFSSSFRQSSFPSDHATAAWAMAAVIGDEYRGWLPRVAVYTLAATASGGRVVAEKHFPSDVLVGSALGWLVGHYVYRTHHNYDLTPYYSDDSTPSQSATLPTTIHSTTASNGIEAPSAAPAVPQVPAPTRGSGNGSGRHDVEDDDDARDQDTIGSPNVPMDSWVYPALERLAALGFIPSQSSSIRPWTRVECARQIAEAEGIVAGGIGDDQHLSEAQLDEASRLLDPLEREFEGTTHLDESSALESLYTRYGNIAGPVLADSYHFGQTWWNDFGRPLGRGGSSLLGFSGFATENRLFLYAREEMQQGPGAAAYSPAVEQVIATVDFNPVHGSVATTSYVRSRPIEMYAGIAFAGNALSFGKQELFWGPTTMGPLMFSSNAEPTYNLRFDSTRPHPLPFLPNLGTYRFDVAIGKLSGHGYDDGPGPQVTSPARPWFNAQKADFNLGQNLELSFTRWSIFWGTGHPMTLHSFLRNFYTFSSADNIPLTVQAARIYPGAYDSGFDFRYRLPGLRRLVTLYADGYANDDPNPIDAPRRAMWNPGIYFARLPWLPHMDFRVEAVSSEQLARDLGGHFYYFKNYYRDESLNKGFLLGNAVGRDSRAEEGLLGWWFTSQTRVEGGFRQNKGGTMFLPGGSTITDGFVRARVQISQHWSADIFSQYERFLIPSYMQGPQSNRSGWLEMVWTPDLKVKK